MPDAFRTSDPDARASGGGDDRSRLDALFAGAAGRHRDTTTSERVLGDIRSTLAEGGESEAVALLHRIVAAGASRPAATVDAALADALALTVAVVRDAAGRLRAAEARERWASAAASTSAQVLAGGGRRPLDHVPEHAAQAAGADFGALTLCAGAGLLRLRAVSGLPDADLVGTCPDMADSLAGRVVRTGEAVLAGEYPEAGAIGPVAMVPLRSGDEVIGALAVGRTANRRPFTAADVGDLGTFAAHAANVVAYAWSGAHRHHLAAREQSAEAAAELTDHVVGDLFTVGLGLQGIISVTTAPGHRDRLTRHVESIAATTARVRDFFSADLLRRAHPVPLSLRLLSAVDAAELVIGSPIRVAITGSVNRAVPPELADEVVEVVRDALTTVADAGLVELSVGCDGSEFTMTVLDDGVASLARSRLVARLRPHAEDHRSVRPGRVAGGGNRLVWTVRLA